MATLIQLQAAGDYRPCDWDLRADLAGLEYWLGVFRWHLDAVLVPLIREEYAPNAAELAAFRDDYLAAYAALARDGGGAHDASPTGPAPLPVDLRSVQRLPLDVLRFTALREEVHQRHNFHDPFRGLKRRENEAALALLPAVLAEIDAAGPAARGALLAVGLMAGNIFDLGSRTTIEMHRDGLLGFAATRARLPTRPWLRDDAEALAVGSAAEHQGVERDGNGGAAYRHAVFFSDNAGSDVLLGCLPVVREFCRRGTRVTIAANSGPALNDITAAELMPLLDRVAERDQVLAAAWRGGPAQHAGAAWNAAAVRPGRDGTIGRLRVLATGSHTPLIDLTRLTDEFVAATADADLLILHGMGRAIESNFHARFACDVVHSAVLKDERVAARLGGKVFDCVLRFTRAAASGGRTRGSGR